MKLIVRGMVLAAVIAAFGAVISADTVLDHASGTYFAVLIFTPFLLLPGVLVWFRPEARSLALWAVWSGIGGIVYAIGGSPYRYERERVHWPWVSWSMGTAIAIAAFGSIFVAFILAAKSREQVPASKRAIRIQRVTSLVAVAAAISVVLGFFAMDKGTISAPVWIGLLVALVAAPAPLVYRRAHRRAALFWAGWASPFGGFIGLIFATEDLYWNPHEHLLFVAYGMLALLTVIVLPIVAFTSSADPELPEARAR